MSRDWANESWRKLYVRESTGDLALLWQARTLRPFLIMYCDRMGLLEVESGPRRIRLVSTLLRLPEDYVRVGLEDLMADGSVVECGRGYFLPKFEEAQRARKTVAQRVREHRERRAVLLRNVSAGNKKLLFDTDKKRRDQNLDSPPAVAVAVPAPAPRTTAAAVEVQSAQAKISQTTAAASPPAAVVGLKGRLQLTKAQREFLDAWNAMRRERKMSIERLTAPMLPRLDAVWSAAELQFPESALPAIGLMMARFLDAKMPPEGDGTNLRGLNTLLNPDVWRARLDTACATLHRREAEEVSRRRL